MPTDLHPEAVAFDCMAINNAGGVHLEMTAEVFLCLAAAVQLAARHPHGGATVARAAGVILAVERTIPRELRAYRALIQAGWDPRQDVETATWQCRVCGCTDHRGCTLESGVHCHWVEPNLCSRCAAVETNQPQPTR